MPDTYSIGNLDGRNDAQGSGAYAVRQCQNTTPKSPRTRSAISPAASIRQHVTPGYFGEKSPRYFGENKERKSFPN
jgi:hypothetical protein